MYEETRVRALLQRLEVSVDGVLGAWAEDVSDHVVEVLECVRVVGQPARQMFLDHFIIFFYSNLNWLLS